MTKIPAPFKLAGLLFFAIGTAIIPFGHPEFFVLPAILIGIVLFVARAPVRPLLVKLIVMEPLVVGVSVMMLLQPDGVARFFFVLLRGTLSLGVMVLLTEMMSLHDILQALRFFHFPELLVDTIALMRRYAFLLSDEQKRMARARQSRSFAKRGRVSWLVLSGVVGVLFIRAMDRSERVHAAMLARGWNAPRR